MTPYGTACRLAELRQQGLLAEAARLRLASQAGLANGRDRRPSAHLILAAPLGISVLLALTGTLTGAAVARAVDVPSPPPCASPLDWLASSLPANGVVPSPAGDET